jgi:hypothetical protein
MRQTIMIAAIVGVVLLTALVTGILVFRLRPRKLKASRFQDKWRELQKLCASKETWNQAIIEADNLLDEALKKKRFIGKTMGERLTKAQRVMSNNEAVWFGHKLRSKLESSTPTKLSETDVKQALMGIRQALKDLGAFPNDK